MRHGILVLLMAGSAAPFSCKATSNRASVASASDEDNYCTLPKGVPVLSVAVDPSIAPKDDAADSPSNAPFMAKSGRGLVLINQINNEGEYGKTRQRHIQQPRHHVEIHGGRVPVQFSVYWQS